jgi:hypothetical protein
MITIQARASGLPMYDAFSRFFGRGICLGILERVFSNHHRRILVEQDVLLRCAVEDVQNFEEADLINTRTHARGQITVLISGTSESFGL